MRRSACRGVKAMGNIRHKWMTMLVVLVTTFATAQEVARQYDGLREQANEWASSRLLASLLNTSAPEEVLLEAQAVSAVSASCSAVERSGEPARQRATQTTNQLIETKSATVQQRDEASHIAINGIPAPLDTQHVELSEARRELLESITEVALLADKNHAVELEALGQPEAIEEQSSAPEDNDADADSDIHAKPEMRFINRVITEAPPRASETDINVARAAIDARVQTRATMRAVRILQERAGRPIRLELKIIRKGDPPSGTTPAPLRAANSASQIDAAPTPDELPAPPAFEDIAAESPNSACASE